jgi:hypothetical protein
MKAFKTQGVKYACIKTKAPHWYFVSDSAVSRTSRLRKMACVTERYLYEATGRTYDIGVAEEGSNTLCVEASLIPDTTAQVSEFVPTPALP